MYEYGGKSFGEPIMLYVYVCLEASFNTTEVGAWGGFGKSTGYGMCDLHDGCGC